MNHKYGYDIRRAQKRRDRSGWGVGIVCLIVIVMFVAIAVKLAMEVNESANAKPKIMHDSLGMVYTYNGEIIREYVFTDPDSGLQYLINDRGGQSPRWNRDGTQMYVGTVNDR